MSDQDDKDKPPGLDERYSTAISASNLRVEAQRGGPADVIIAAGLSNSELGGMLLRLHSEWDGAEKPRRPDAGALMAAWQKLALEDKKVIFNGKRMTVAEAAEAEAAGWYLNELRLLMGKLKTLPRLRAELFRIFFMTEQHIAEVLLWWLDPVCHTCEGRKRKKIEGTPSLGPRLCAKCQGTGESRIPHDDENPRYERGSEVLLRYIKDCLNDHRSQLKNRLARTRTKK